MDYLFTGYVHPEPMFKDDDAVPASEFSDVHVRAMKLDGIPLTWGHHQDISIGEVEETWDTATGAKGITGRIRGDSPLARSVINRMRNSQLNELSLETDYQIEGEAGRYYTEGKTPIRVAVVQKGERKNCFIHPNSVVEVPPRRNRPERPILRKEQPPVKADERSMAAPAGSETTAAAAAPPAAAEPPADSAAGTAAAPPPAAAAADTTDAQMADDAGSFDDLLDADKLMSNPKFTQETLANLLAAVSQRHAADKAMWEQTRDELAQAKAQAEKAAESLTKTHEEELQDMANKYFDNLKASGVAVEDGAAEQFAKLYEHWGPQERIENGRFLQKTVFAHSASFAEMNRRKDAEIERLKQENFQIAQKLDSGDTAFNRYKQIIDERAFSATGAAVPNLSGGDGNPRPGKRSKPESASTMDFSRFLPPPFVGTSSSDK